MTPAAASQHRTDTRRLSFDRIERDDTVGTYPVPSAVADRAVELFHGMTVPELLAMLAGCREEPNTPVMLTDGIETVAADLIDPLRHLLSRIVRRHADAAYVDPTPRVNRRVQRVMREANTRRTSVVVLS